MSQLILRYYFAAAFVPCFYWSIWNSPQNSVFQFLYSNIFQLVLTWLCLLIVMLRGNVKVIPEPKKKDKDCFSVCHWNLDSTHDTHDCSILFPLKSYNSLYKFDIYVSQKHILILILLLLKTIWKFLTTRSLVLTTRLIPNAEMCLYY